jgi:hypothetical protein
MAPEFIFTTYRLARHYPPDRTVLKNISLSVRHIPERRGGLAFRALPSARSSCSSMHVRRAVRNEPTGDP